MGHLMPGHVLSLTAGAAAYESKCALKISFSSRDRADKELARARTSYGISYVASIYLISVEAASLFTSPFCRFFRSSSFLAPMSHLYARAAMHVASRI